ncbi:hypothetical protein OIV83_006477 [Microbotryomycetes sp. JL201]|nr:hypothetical protein OIV83_006477 [Microbotryomycetes sp. JL201]
MVAGLDGFSWFGLVVYVAVMGLVIRGVTIPVPASVSRPLRQLLISARILDPIAASLRSSSGTLDDPATATPSGTIPPAGKDISRSPSTLNGTKGLQTRENPRWKLVLDLRSAPVTGVILLLITTTIDGSVLRLGIVGDESVRPYDVLVLFFSLAYISTALDSTGGLRSLAFWISQKTAKAPKAGVSGDKVASGFTLFTVLYAFWFGSGLFVGNDPIVLSGTAFLGYFTRVTGIANPTAWIFSQFQAANIASAALVSSNPTNAFHLNFLTGFTANTIFPTLVTAIAGFALLVLVFAKIHPRAKDTMFNKTGQQYIPKHLLPPDVSPRSALLDPAGALFHSGLMAVTLGLLVGTSFLRVEVWMITLPAGVLAFARDIASEIRKQPDQQEQIEMVVPGTKKAEVSRRNSLPALVRAFKRRFPTTARTIAHLPFSLVLFAGGIFVLSRAMTTLGWTPIFATWLARICVNPPAAVFFLGYFVAFVMCPLFGTNIGATILAVEILRDPNFANAAHVVADRRIMHGAIFSTAMATNIGAFSWTLSSSLAGLLWVTILQQKGITVTNKDFAKWNMLFLPALSTLSSAAILLQTYFFPLQ